jgi:magnesium transporter
MERTEKLRPVKVVQSMLELDDRIELTSFLESLPASDLIFLMSKLEKKDQHKLLTLINPDEAADVIEELPDIQAVDIIEDMDASDAAAIINKMMSDDRADLIMELDKKDAEAILSEMNPEQAASTREMIEYDTETAGGLMVIEYISYPVSMTVKEVTDDLKKNAGKYEDLIIRYIYVVSNRGRLVGVLQMQDLLFFDPARKLSEIVVKDVLAVNVNDDLDSLKDLFETHDYYGFPVVDDNNALIGVLRRKNVLEAINERSAIEHLESQGIIGGDELRTMPVLLRSRRRLTWLSVNILLNLIAASVIAFYQETLSTVIALAVFLPIVSDMSGCTGNQAVAVSMRELSLGTVRPTEVLRVWWQEVSVGLINGLVLGLLIGAAAFFWKGNIYFGLVVGSALAVNTLVAVSLGGTIPLILKRMKVDPALASGPILTTITDMVGFFLTLCFATFMLSRISGL